jgi:hypothetical protein
MICKFERKGKATTIIEGYEGRWRFKILAKEIKTKLSVGGTFKDDSIIIQEITDKIMEILKLKGFKVKRRRVKNAFSQLETLNFKQKTNDTIIRINIIQKVYHLNLKPENIAHHHICRWSKPCRKITQFLTALNFRLKKENSKHKPVFLKANASP